MAKISVIVPVYNTSKYIKKCLDSVLNQTMNDLEIIIVNDGSTDDSEEIIEEWIKKNKDKIQIKYFQKENGGLSETRNFGAKHATGEYITFLDSDDYLDVNIYRNLEKYMEEKIELIKFKICTVNEKNEILQKFDGPAFGKITGPEAFKKLYDTDTYMDISCIYLYKREFYLKNNFEFELKRYHEDFGLVPWIIVNAKSVVSTEYYGYFYLRRENSITDTQNPEKEKKKAYDSLKHYDNAIQRITKKNFDNYTTAIFKRYYTNALLLKVKNLSGQEQKEFLKCLKTRRVYKNINPDNLKQLLKRILIMINIKLYLKLR